VSQSFAHDPGEADFRFAGQIMRNEARARVVSSQSMQVKEYGDV